MKATQAGWDKRKRKSKDKEKSLSSADGRGINNKERESRGEDGKEGSISNIDDLRHPLGHPRNDALVLVFLLIN
jgi:hypothetical protein